MQGDLIDGTLHMSPYLAGLAAAANNPVIAFQKEQLAKAAAIQAQRAELQKQIDAYLRMF